MVEAIGGTKTVGALETAVGQEQNSKDKVVPCWTPPFVQDQMVSAAPKAEETQSIAKAEESQSWSFFGTVRSIWNWITGREVDEELAPEQQEQLTHCYRKTKEALVELSSAPKEEIDETLDIARALVQLYKELDLLKGEAIRTQAVNFQQKRKETDEKVKEIEAKRDELIKSLKNSDYFKRFFHAIAPLQAAMIAFTGGTYAGVMVLSLAVTLAIEEMSGGKGKEWVAKQFAGDDTIKQDNIEARLQSWSTLLSVGLAVYGSQSPEAAARAATLMEGTAGALQGVTKYRVDQRQAELIELKFKHERLEKKRNKTAGNMANEEKARIEYLGKVIRMLQNEIDTGIAVLN